MTSRVATEIDVLRVFDNADDRHVGNIVEPDSFAEHVGRAEEVARHLLVENDDFRSAEPILVVEVASVQQGYAEHFEVVAGDDCHVARSSFTFARIVSLDNETELVPTSGDRCVRREARRRDSRDRKSTRLNSSHSQISYAVFCLKKKKKMTQKRILHLKPVLLPLLLLRHTRQAPTNALPLTGDRTAPPPHSGSVIQPLTLAQRLE